MTQEVVTASPEMTVRAAMELLASRHVSGVPVVSGHAVVGVVTATDLMGFAASLSGVPTERDTRDDWGEVDEPLIDATIDAEAESGSAFFSERWDDAGDDVSTRMASLGGLEWNALEEHVVSEVMTYEPLTTLPPEASAESAAELMRRHAIHRVLVVNADRRLVGIVSALDIAGAAADHRFTSRTYVFNDDR